jgi:hypothetical protein
MYGAPGINDALLNSPRQLYATIKSIYEGNGDVYASLCRYADQSLQREEVIKFVIVFSLISITVVVFKWYIEPRGFTIEPQKQDVFSDNLANLPQYTPVAEISEGLPDSRCVASSKKITVPEHLANSPQYTPPPVAKINEGVIGMLLLPDSRRVGLSMQEEVDNALKGYSPPDASEGVKTPEIPQAGIRRMSVLTIATDGINSSPLLQSQKSVVPGDIFDLMADHFEPDDAQHNQTNAEQSGQRTGVAEEDDAQDGSPNSTDARPDRITRPDREAFERDTE